MIEYPRSGSEKNFEKSSYGIIRRITPIPRHLQVVEQPVGPEAGFSPLLPLQYGQPYGGFDFGYAVSDLQGEQQLRKSGRIDRLSA